MLKVHPQSTDRQGDLLWSWATPLSTPAPIILPRSRIPDVQMMRDSITQLVWVYRMICGHFQMYYWSLGPGQQYREANEHYMSLWVTVTWPSKHSPFHCLPISTNVFHPLIFVLFLHIKSVSTSFSWDRSLLTYFKILYNGWDFNIH